VLLKYLNQIKNYLFIKLQINNESYSILNATQCSINNNDDAEYIAKRLDQEITSRNFILNLNQLF